ncbi:MAG: LysR family transcriptional regulator [Rhizobiales bacterium]|nr:LysR family transcriptional regulator [Hyphomicrobiales bacterium]
MMIRICLPAKSTVFADPVTPDAMAMATRTALGVAKCRVKDPLRFSIVSSSTLAGLPALSAAAYPLVHDRSRRHEKPMALWHLSIPYWNGAAAMPWDDKVGRRLKLKDLQALMAVVDAGGVGKAADRLNYSQPAVSKAIANLERTLGRRLLERGRNGIELTPYGDAMIKCGVAVFDDLRKGIEEIDFLTDPTSGEVRIGSTEPVSAGILSAVVHQLARRYPRLAFDVVVRDPSGIYRELEQRNIDFALVQLVGHIESDHMKSEILYHEPVVVVAGAQHPLARKRHVELADLANEPWVLPDRASFISSVVANCFRAKGLKAPVTALVAASAYFRLMLVAGGHFLTVVPAVMVQVGRKPWSLKMLPVELPGNRRPVGIVTLKSRALSPVAQLCIEHIRAVAKTMARK